MGTILNRSIFVTLITYTGVVIGYLNVLWLMPKVLDTDQIGLFRTLQDMAMLFVPFAQMGAGQGLLRYFPQGSDKKEQQQIVTLSFLWTLGCYVFFLLAFWVVHDWIEQMFAEKAGAVSDYLGVVLLLTFILSIRGLLEALSRSLLKFRFITFANEIVLRLLTAVLILLYFLQLISFHQSLWGLVVLYGLVTLLMAFYLAKSGWGSPRFNFSERVKQMALPFGRYGVITFLSSASALLVMKTDSLMITQMLGLSANGIYTTVFYIAIIVELPRRILSQISMPLLAQAFEKQNMKMASQVYQKSSINLLLVGGLLYVGVMCNLPALFNFMPQGEEFRAGFGVVLLIGLGKLVDGAAGMNGEILIMSRYYKMNLYFTIAMALLNVLLNYLLIPPLGINGAALASCLSLIAFNGIKYYYVQAKMGIQPLSRETLWLLLILAVAFLAGWFLPALPYVLPDMLLRSLLITAIVGVGVLYFNISEEANTLWTKGLNFVRDQF